MMIVVSERILMTDTKIGAPQINQQTAQEMKDSLAENSPAFQRVLQLLKNEDEIAFENVLDILKSPGYPSSVPENKLPREDEFNTLIDQLSGKPTRQEVLRQVASIDTGKALRVAEIFGVKRSEMPARKGMLGFLRDKLTPNRS